MQQEGDIKHSMDMNTFGVSEKVHVNTIPQKRKSETELENSRLMKSGLGTQIKDPWIMNYQKDSERSSTGQTRKDNGKTAEIGVVKEWEGEWKDDGANYKFQRKDECKGKLNAIKKTIERLEKNSWRGECLLQTAFLLHEHTNEVSELVGMKDSKVAAQQTCYRLHTNVFDYNYNYFVIS